MAPARDPYQLKLLRHAWGHDLYRPSLPAVVATRALAYAVDRGFDGPIM